MEIKKIFRLFILCGSLLLSGCGASKASTQYEDDNISIAKWETESREITDVTESAEGTRHAEETETEYEPEAIGEDREPWGKKIYVTADEVQGNILGYSLRRMPPNPENMYYEQDMPYLLEEELVGKGIYVSDYMCETEIFLGSILKDVIENRGIVGDEYRQYFTEYALQQLQDTDWELLEENWEIEPYTYDREYCMNPLYGGGYQFFYHFFPDKEKIDKEETSKIDIVLYIDVDGKICEIKTCISTVPTEEAGIEKWISMEGLFDDTYCEQVIRNGSPCKEEMVWDFERYFRRFITPDEVYVQSNEGLLASGNVCASAENLTDIFLQVIADRGTGVEKYAEWFGYDESFMSLVNMDWDLLEENWIASEEYDCFFIDKVSFLGYAVFRYYFYPDFEIMSTDTAKVVVMDCGISSYNGLIDYNNINIFPLSKEEYREVKQSQDKSKTLVVDKGIASLGNIKVAIPSIDRQVDYMLVDKFELKDVASVGQGNRKVNREIWGFTDTAEVGNYLGEKFLQDFEEDSIEEGEIYKLARDKEYIHSDLYDIDCFMEDGWKADKHYDCFYVCSNEAAECMHLQYYFYPERIGGEPMTGRTLVIDMFVSEEGIESMDVNEFCQNENVTIIENPYFPYKEHISLQVHAEYHNGTEFVDETAGAEINRVKICQEGSIYRLTIHITPFMSSWYFPPDDIMNIYLYVTADKIYRILPYAQLEPNGATVDFYDNDELLVKTLDTDEKLRKNSVIVCQEEEMQEDFFSIIQEGNKVTYYLSETKENGEPGQKDLFVWEKGKGLVEFGTGFGPGPMDVHIDKICEALEDE